MRIAAGLSRRIGEAPGTVTTPRSVIAAVMVGSCMGAAATMSSGAAIAPRPLPARFAA